MFWVFIASALPSPILLAIHWVLDLNSTDVEGQVSWKECMEPILYG